MWYSPSGDVRGLGENQAWRSAMMRCAGLCALAAVALLGVQGAAVGAEAMPLAFKFSPEDVMTYEVSVTGAGSLRSSEGDLSAVGLQGSLSLSCRVTEVLADGSGRLEARMPRANMQVNVGEQSARFSYENGRLRWFANGQERTPPDADLSQAPLLGTPIVFTMAPNGRMSGVSLADPRLLGALQQAAPGLPIGQLPQGTEQLFPDAPVSVGETWRKSAQFTPFGPTMPITLTTSRTLDSVSEEGGIAKISGYSEARFQAPQVNMSPGGTEVGVAVPQLRQTIASTEFFDTSRGRLLRADYDMSFSTLVAITAGEEKRDGGAEARFHITVQAR